MDKRKVPFAIGELKLMEGLNVLNIVKNIKYVIKNIIKNIHVKNGMLH